MGEDSRLILQHDLKCNNPTMEHILKGPNCVFILIESTAADPGQLNRLVHRFSFSGVQHPPGIHYLTEDFWKSFCIYNVIVWRF